MALLKAKQVSMQEPINIVTNIFYLDTKKKKTIYTGKLPTSKRRKKNLFGFSQKDIKQEKKKKLAWIIQWQSVNTG